MKVKIKNILWLLLAYALFYCFDMALFPDYITDINIAILSLTLIALAFNKKIKRKDVLWLGIFVVYAVYIVWQTIISSMVTSNLPVFKFYIFYPALMVIGILLSNSYFYDLTKQQNLLWKIMCGWGLILFVLGLYEIVTRNYILSVTASELSTYMRSFSGGATLGLIRARVFSGGYLIIGDLFGVLAIAAYYLYHRYRKNIYLVSAILLFIGAFLGFSRGSMVGAIAGFLVVFILDRKELSKKISRKQIYSAFKWIVLIVIAILIILALSKTNEIVGYWVDRVTTIFDWTDDTSNVGRLDHWMAFIDVWLSSPRNFLIGTGGLTAGSLTSYSVTESGILEHLVEIGLIGTIFYYIILLFPFVRYIRLKIKTDFGNWVISCFTIIFVHDIILQVSFVDNISLLMWIFVMLMIIENRRIEVMGTELLASS